MHSMGQREAEACRPKYEDLTTLRLRSPRTSEGIVATHKSGYVSVLGETNVGKSTFLNAVLGKKLLISSPKPQATRNRIRCVLTTEEAQIVFLDTPGLHRPKTKLGRRLVREAYRGLRGIDLLLYVVEPWGQVSRFDREALDRLENAEVPIILLVNKIDLAKGNALEETLIAYAATERFAELIPISSTQRIRLDDVIDTITKYLPEGDPIFPAEVICDRSEEFLIEEIIREKAFQHTFEEVPYSIAVRVKWLRETSDTLYEIRAEILVERESQKGILVGKGGRTVKQIGTLARKEIEKLLGRQVFLDLIVRVSSGWTKDDGLIQQLTEP
jgi:GTP-binding protein Era